MIPGPTNQAIGERARKHGMDAVCPIREQAPEGKRYNTAVLLDREGKVAGCYPKVLVFWGEGLNPGEAGVKVVETSCSTVAAK